MTAPAWMPLHVAEYLADTGHLSTVEHGAYVLLMMHYWQRGGLPTDDAKLARVTRLPLKEWTAMRSTIAELFGEEWRHTRIDDELAKARLLIGKRSNAGKASAERRRQQSANTRSTHVETPHQQVTGQLPKQEPEDNKRTPSESSASQGAAAVEAPPLELLPDEPKPKTFREIVEAEFDDVFWPAYPMKKDRKDARAAFYRARGKAKLGAIMAGLEAYIAETPPDRPWRYAATFLNKETWENVNEPQPEPRAPSRREPAHTTIRRALAEMAANADNDDGRPPLSRQRSDADGGGPGGDGGGDDDLEIPPFMRR